MTLIVGIHFDLVIARESIHERYASESTCIVDHNVGDGEREFVFQACFIEVPEVDTDLDLFVLFNNKDNVGNPIWVLLYHDEARVDEFLGFILDGFYYL